MHNLGQKNRSQLRMKSGCVEVGKAFCSITCRESLGFGLAVRGQTSCARPAGAAELMHVRSICQSLGVLSLPIGKQLL